jgi:hypothetical protein
MLNRMNRMVMEPEEETREEDKMVEGLVAVPMTRAITSADEIFSRATGVAFSISADSSDTHSIAKMHS